MLAFLSFPFSRAALFSIDLKVISQGGIHFAEAFIGGADAVLLLLFCRLLLSGSSAQKRRQLGIVLYCITVEVSFDIRLTYNKGQMLVGRM